MRISTEVADDVALILPLSRALDAHVSLRAGREAVRDLRPGDVIMPENFTRGLVK